MELSIDPEAVNRLVADAILKSAIGEAVKKAVDKEIGNLNKSYDNPIDAVIRNHTAEIVRQVLRDEYSEMIRQKIAEALSHKLSLDFIDRVCEKAADRYA